MKKYFYLSLLAIAFISCSKEAKTPENLKQQMVDNWFYRGAYSINYSAKGQPLDSTRILTTTKDIFNFKSDGSFTTTNNNGKETTSGTFTTPTTSTFVLRETGVSTPSTCRVISINLDTFIFAVPQVPKVTGQPYTETKVTLFR
ncbi:hypothetical protein [Mucilaginibacter galii]|nr:hypothetical protein [Mucilaginibacter galii]